MLLTYLRKRSDLYGGYNSYLCDGDDMMIFRYLEVLKTWRFMHPQTLIMKKSKDINYFKLQQRVLEFLKDSTT